MTTQRIALVALVVDDYDRAIDWYTDALGFDLVETVIAAAGKRWVVVAPAGGSAGSGTHLLLAQAVGGEQKHAVGNQTGGRVFLFLHTSDFEADHARLLKAGVRFLESPRREAYGQVAVFEDVYGNRWDLLEPAVDSG